MRFYLISDNIDTQVGLRLAGVKGVVVHTAEEVRDALEKACAMPDVGVVLVTAKLVELCPDLIYRYKLVQRTPLIVEISDRHGAGGISESITRYVRESVGISI